VCACFLTVNENSDVKIKSPDKQANLPKANLIIFKMFIMFKKIQQAVLEGHLRDERACFKKVMQKCILFF
jgi:hypothetical protein